jgi:hypothetical protein
MGNHHYREVRKIFPLSVSEREDKLVFPLAWALTGRAHALDEPELTVTSAEATALDGEIYLELTVEQVTLYLREEGAPVQRASSVHRLTRLIGDKNVKPGLQINLEATVSLRGGWAVIPDEGNTAVQGECVADVHCVVWEEKELSLPTAEEVDGEVMADAVTVETVCGRFAQTLDLALPMEWPGMADEAGYLQGTLVNVRATPLCGWLKFEGDVAVDVTFLSGEEARPEKFVFPLREYIEVPGAAADMTASLQGQVRLLACRRKEPGTTAEIRGLLEVEGILLLAEPLLLPLSQPNAVPLSHLAPFHHQGPVILDEVVGAGSSQTLIQREIIFSRQVRRVRDPVDARVRNLQHEIIANKVIVRGVLHKQLYAVDAETGAVFAQDVSERFVHFVDVPGAAPGMRAHVAPRVEFVRVEVLPGGETARQVTIIEFMVKVTRAVKKFFSPEYPCKPVHPKPPKPPERVYTVRSGDSVWKIANRFGVSMEAIIQANHLANPNLIFPGQQLIIPR